MRARTILSTSKIGDESRNEIEILSILYQQNCLF